MHLCFTVDPRWHLCMGAQAIRSDGTAEYGELLSTGYQDGLAVPDTGADANFRTGHTETCSDSGFVYAEAGGS